MKSLIQIPVSSCIPSLVIVSDKPSVSGILFFMASKNYMQTVPLVMGRSKQAKQIVGKKFGHLLVLEYLGYYTKPSGSTVQCVLCICDCGNTRKCEPYLLLTNQLKSCGCQSDRMGAEKRVKHGCARSDKDTIEYKAWLSMTQRCYTSTTIEFKNYGGRGIIVCDRWRDSNGFINFLSDMGLKPSAKHSLDRYPDTNGNYEPNNCRWATREQQANNTTRNKYFIINGEKITQAQAMRKYNLSVHFLNKKYKSI